MPYRAKRACMHPGCSDTYDGLGAYCPKHKPMHDADKRYNETRRDQARAYFYTSSRWRKIRHAFLAVNPLCFDCQREGRTKLAEQVHHIDDDYQHNDDDNLLALCTSCHAKRTRMGL